MPKKTPPKKNGRPTKLSPQIQLTIVAALRVGSYVETACAFAGISKETFYKWLKSGQAGNEEHKEFSDAVEKAQAEAELRHVQRIDDASKKEWQASAWMLERKFPKRWGRQDRTENQLPGTAILVLPAKLTPEEYERQWLKNHPEKIQ